MSTLSLRQSRDGVVRCARYAFGPNRLHLCGPDANREVLAYLNEGESDLGLTQLLRQFNTLHPYLKQIAEANSITDPFDERVVEAYWVGNELLEKVPVRTFYRHLTDTLRLHARGRPEDFDRLTAKLPRGARMHHSFHVFNVYERTGHDQRLHTLESMDACRISWGRVTEVAGPTITMRRRPLQLSGHQLVLGEEQDFSVARRLEDDALGEELKPGQWLTVHWDVPCEVVNDQDVLNLEHYTRLHLKLANQTL